MLNGGKKKSGGGLKAITARVLCVCCVCVVCGVCYSRDGAFVQFGKADERVSP